MSETIRKSVGVVVVYPDGSSKTISVEPCGDENICITDEDRDAIWIPLTAAEALRDAIGEVVASMGGKS